MLDLYVKFASKNLQEPRVTGQILSITYNDDTGINEVGGKPDLDDGSVVFTIKVNDTESLLNKMKESSDFYFFIGTNKFRTGMDRYDVIKRIVELAST